MGLSLHFGAAGTEPSRRLRAVAGEEHERMAQRDMAW